MTVVRAARGSSLATGIASNAAVGGVNILAGILLLPVVLSTYGPTSYGFWLLLSTLATYLFQVDLGMGSALVHHLARLATTEKTRAAQLLSSGLAWMTGAGLVATVLYAVGAVVVVATKSSETSLSTREVQALLVLGGVLTVALGIRALSAFLQGSGSWVLERRTQLVGALVRATGTIAACTWGKSVVWVAAAEVGALLVPPVLCGIYVLLRVTPRPTPRLVQRADIKLMQGFGIRAFTVGAMSAVLLQLNTVIVGLVVSTGAVAAYAAAFRVYQGVRLLLSWLTAPIEPAVSRMHGRDAAEARSLTLALLFGALWVGNLITLTLAFCCFDLVRTWLPSSISSFEVSVILLVLLVGMTFNSAHIAALPAANGFGVPGAFVGLHFAWCLTDVVLAVGLGKLIGVYGVALGITLPILILEPFYVLRFHQAFGISPREWLAHCLKPTIVLLLPGLCVAGLTLVGLTVTNHHNSDGYLAASAFAFASLISGVLMRNKVPFEALRGLGQARV